MPSLISEDDKVSFRNIYIDFFESFKQDITVYKTPKKIVSNVSEQGTYGYGSKAHSTNFTLIPVSGTFSAVVTYAEDQIDDTLSDANEKLQAGEAIIDVSGDARDYIKNGITSLIEINGSKFIVMSHERLKDFLGYNFYSYRLKETS